MGSSRHIVIAAVLAGMCASVAAAPDEPADDVAQQLFSRGVDAARQNNWIEARQAFEEAYRLAPKLVVLINLAGAQARTGRLVEAFHNYQRVLDASTSRDTAEYGQAAKAILPSLEPRIPRVRVNPAGLGPSDVVAIDGNQIPSSALEKPVLVDPGAHTLTVRRDGAQRTTIDFSVAESESHDVSVPAAIFTVAPAPAVTLSPMTAPPRRAERRHWWKSAWFWTATAGVLAASAVTLILIEQRPQPYAGNVGSGLVNIP